MADSNTPAASGVAGGILRTLRRFLLYAFLLLLVVGGTWFWWKHYYVFGEGVKSGELNYLVRKGNVFKTYEGKLIQSGFRSGTTGAIQSYEFEFSVASDSIANILMLHSGGYFDLHYREYKAALPWRGYSRYVVDRIVKMGE